MHLMIFYPGGVSRGFPVDINDDQEILSMVDTVLTTEEGNGNGKIKEREKLNLLGNPSYYAKEE